MLLFFCFNVSGQEHTPGHRCACGGQENTDGYSFILCCLLKNFLINFYQAEFDKIVFQFSIHFSIDLFVTCKEEDT